jgi:hypothetical protein
MCPNDNLTIVTKVLFIKKPNKKDNTPTISTILAKVFFQVIELPLPSVIPKPTHPRIRHQ